MSAEYSGKDLYYIRYSEPPARCLRLGPLSFPLFTTAQTLRLAARYNGMMVAELRPEGSKRKRRSRPAPRSAIRRRLRPSRDYETVNQLGRELRRMKTGQEERPMVLWRE